MNEGLVEQAAHRGMLKGMAAGSVIVATITFAVMMNAGAGVVPSLGVAAFATFWGGPGFGGMLGATTAAVRAEKTMSSLPSATPAVKSTPIEGEPAHRAAA